MEYYWYCARCLVLRSDAHEVHLGASPGTLDRSPSSSGIDSVEFFLPMGLLLLRSPCLVPWRCIFGLVSTAPQRLLLPVLYCLLLLFNF